MQDTRQTQNDGEDMDRVGESKKHRSRRSKKRAQAATEPEAVGDIKAVASDSRFSALFDDPSYAIDPTAAEFKKGEGLEELVEETAKRRKQSSLAAATASRGKSRVDRLVESIKSKSSSRRS